ncbi:MAG: GNAT family N-acetyltransferase [Rhodococcus sp. (in: high G+C Gram-positive bacteria)]|uniref:GNAT family N-acetyltransferase n=1 Tax=Rhodococcus sp. TaxID=1831 RepID=UPI003BB6583A
MPTTSIDESAISVAQAGIWDTETLADVAATTFPLACPPEAHGDDIADFIARTLSVERFGEYLTDPTRIVLKASIGGEIVGYLMAIDAPPPDPLIAAMITATPSIEISKLYVLPGRHGTGVSAALMAALVERAAATGRAGLWLGVNQGNERAQRFYIKQGFRTVGTRTFLVGSQEHQDYVMQREL